jgi:predicted SprT family Zn-dependent metalloprotease
MKIPKSFKLFGETIKVEINPNLVTKEGAWGMARYDSDTISLQPNTKDHYTSDDQMYQVFSHELVHFILDRMCEIKLRNNEKFVDVFASLLHQALTTMTYDK